MTIMYPFCSYCQDVFSPRRNGAAWQGGASEGRGGAGASERNNTAGQERVGRNMVAGASEREILRERRVRQGGADASRREDADDDGASGKGMLQGGASGQKNIAASDGKSVAGGGFARGFIKFLFLFGDKAGFDAVLGAQRQADFARRNLRMTQNAGFCGSDGRF